MGPLNSVRFDGCIQRRYPTATARALEILSGCVEIWSAVSENSEVLDQEAIVVCSGCGSGNCVCEFAPSSCGRLFQIDCDWVIRVIKKNHVQKIG